MQFCQRQQTCLTGETLGIAQDLLLVDQGIRFPAEAAESQHQVTMPTQNVVKFRILEFCNTWPKIGTEMNCFPAGTCHEVWGYAENIFYLAVLERTTACA